MAQVIQPEVWKLGENIPKAVCDIRHMRVRSSFKPELVGPTTVSPRFYSGSTFDPAADRKQVLADTLQASSQDRLKARTSNLIARSDGVAVSIVSPRHRALAPVAMPALSV